MKPSPPYKIMTPEEFEAMYRGEMPPLVKFLLTLLGKGPKQRSKKEPPVEKKNKKPRPKRS